MAENQIEIPETLEMVSTIQLRLPDSISGFARSSEADLLKKAREIANDETVFEEHKPFFFALEGSDNTIDSHFTQMHETSLRNYAVDATFTGRGAPGVSFLRAHARYDTNLGRSLNGFFLDAGGDTPGAKRFVGEFFTYAGLRQGNGFASDDLIFGIRTGTFFDVSIGFKRGEGFAMICSICELDYWSWDCMHIGGETYEKTDVISGAKSDALCYSSIQHARLSEVSVVYDGSNQNSQFLKFERALEAGEASTATIDKMQRLYGLSSGKKLQIFNTAPAGTRAENPTKKVRKMEEENNEALSTYQNSMRALVRETMTAAGIDIPTGTLDIEAQIRELGKTIAAQAALAADGTKFRTEVVEAALKQGKRAFGKDFAEEAKREMLEKMSIEDARGYETTWREIADKTLGAGAKAKGGRQTTDETDATRETDTPTAKKPIKTLSRKSLLPARAFTNG